MTVESADFISELNHNYPDPTNSRSEGDDHIRLLKDTLLNTFPNFSGLVSATNEELNYNDIGTLGTCEARKVVTTDVNNKVTGFLQADGIVSRFIPAENIAGTSKSKAIGGTVERVTISLNNIAASTINQSLLVQLGNGGVLGTDIHVASGSAYPFFSPAFVPSTGLWRVSGNVEFIHSTGNYWVISGSLFDITSVTVWSVAGYQLLTAACDVAGISIIGGGSFTGAMSVTYWRSG